MAGNGRERPGTGFLRPLGTTPDTQGLTPGPGTTRERLALLAHKPAAAPEIFHFLVTRNSAYPRRRPVDLGRHWLASAGPGGCSNLFRAVPDRSRGPRVLRKCPEGSGSGLVCLFHRVPPLFHPSTATNYFSPKNLYYLGYRTPSLCRSSHGPRCYYVL